MSETTVKARIEVVPIADEHAEAVAEFFRVVGWDPLATAAKVRRGRARANPFFEGAEPPTVLFLSDGKVLGYVTSIPVMVWNNGAERRADWIKGVMVHPDHRNGPIGFLLIKELMSRLTCPLSLVVGEPARRLFGALGMTDTGTMPNYIGLLNAGAVLKKLDPKAVGLSLPEWVAGAVRLAQRTGAATLLGACAGSALRLKALVCSRSSRGLRSGCARAFPKAADLDRLWHSVRRELEAAPVRNGRYLTWRYGHDDTYNPIAVTERGELVGFAVVRRPRADGDPRLRGIRTASLSDLVFAPSRRDVAAALLREADAVARSFGADALLCSASHPSLHAALSRRGYFRAPANLHFLLKHSAQRGVPDALSAWWLMRGDANADEVF
jgi:GNAT superfamily N-acetyltransferase